jgi:hypothetical protein
VFVYLKQDEDICVHDNNSIDVIAAQLDACW